MIQENLWDTAQKRGSEKVIRREVMMRQMRDLEGKVRAMFVQSDLGDLVLGRLSDGNSLSNILNGGRIRHFGCKRDVGMLLALIPFRFQRSDRISVLHLKYIPDTDERNFRKCERGSTGAGEMKILYVT